MELRPISLVGTEQQVGPLARIWLNYPAVRPFHREQERRVEDVHCIDEPSRKATGALWKRHWN